MTFASRVLPFVGLLLGGIQNASSQAENAASAPAVSSQPAVQRFTGWLEATPEVWDFGSVWYGDTPQTQIIVRNVGSKPVNLLRAGANCSCTIATKTKNVLAPGETDVVTLRLDTTKNKQRFVQKYAQVDTDTEDQKHLILHVKGEVRPLWEFDPPEPGYIGRVSRYAPFDREVDVRVVYDKPIELKFTGAANAWFDFKFSPIEPGRHYKLRMTGKTPLKTGQMIAYLDFESSLSTAPQYRVPVDGFAMDRVMAVPDWIYVPKERDGPSPQVVRLLYEDQANLQILGIDSNFPQVVINQTKPAEPLKGATGYSVIVIMMTLPPADVIPDADGWIRIHTNAKGFEEVKVVVRHERSPDAGPIQVMKVGP